MAVPTGYLFVFIGRRWQVLYLTPTCLLSLAWLKRNPQYYTEEFQYRPFFTQVIKTPYMSLVFNMTKTAGLFNNIYLIISVSCYTQNRAEE